MRVVVAALLIVYLIGVGVDLASSIWSGWSTGNGSRMMNNITRALPDALASANFGVSPHCGRQTLAKNSPGGG